MLRHAQDRAETDHSRETAADAHEAGGQSRDEADDQERCPMQVRDSGRFRLPVFRVLAPQDQHDVEDDEIGDVAPLQHLARGEARGIGTADAACEKADRQHDDPA